MMSFLSELLGVPEGVPFKIEGRCPTYKIVGEQRKCYQEVPFSGTWFTVNDEVTLLYMIKHKDKIKTVLMLTEKQKIAIKGRIAEGTPWVMRQEPNFLYVNFCKEKPIKFEDSWFPEPGSDFSPSLDDDFYNFVTFENSPIYLPDLIMEE